MLSAMFSIRSAFPVILLYCLVAVITHSAEGRRNDNKISYYQRFTTMTSASYLLQLRDYTGKFFCAGTIVAPQFVVTAAKCFNGRDFTKIVVVAKADELTDEGIQRKIVKVTNDSESNVAVLKLDEPFAESDNVKSLPILDRPLTDKDWILVLGWQHLLDKDIENSKLYAVQLRSVAPEKCDLDINANAERNDFCAAGNGYEGDYPVGDLGGPAVVRSTLAGIALSCHKCNDDEHTNSFIDMHKFHSFVTSAMV